MGVLHEIAARKRERLAGQKSRVPLSELRDRIRDQEAPRDFYRAVRREGRPPIRLIAEVKRASPSQGLIRPEIRPADVARIYDRHAKAISVLTEEDFFQGHLDFIGEVKAASGRPVLRKDFLFNEYQIYESRAAGADAVLLIGALLGKSQAAEYLELCIELGLAVLFEVHDERELEGALDVGATVIGINNRDLETLQVDQETTFRLLREITGGHTAVSESGISTRADVLRLEEAGVDAMLVGTSIMAAPDIEKKILELLPDEKIEA